MSGRNCLPLERIGHISGSWLCVVLRYRGPYNDALNDFRRGKVFLYTSQAESLYHQWQQQKIRVSPHDLRIAAICVANDAATDEIFNACPD